MAQKLKALTKTQVKERSGPDSDRSVSLDSRRDWLQGSCGKCGAHLVVEAPGKDRNLHADQQEVEATLPDGRKIPVTTTVASPKNTLLVECSSCDAVQEVEL